MDTLSCNNICLDRTKFDSRGFGKMKIFVKDLGLHRQLLDLFKTSKIDVFSFTLKEQRKTQTILKGILGSFTSAEVKTDLA